MTQIGDTIVRQQKPIRQVRMRQTKQEVLPDRRKRKREWAIRVPDQTYEPFFGCRFFKGDETYRIEGWIHQNKKNPVYVIRECDEQPFVMSFAELRDDEIGFFQHPKPRPRRRIKISN